jgi:hypothetical protein
MYHSKDISGCCIIAKICTVSLWLNSSEHTGSAVRVGVYIAMRICNTPVGCELM